MKTTITLAAAASFLALSAPAAQAGMLVALTGDDTLVTVDTQTRTATGSTVVSGVGGRLLGIDVRPADGKLYGLFVDGTVATIDPASGAATKVDTLATMPTDGSMVTVDFNPAADALRIMGSDGKNLRTKITGGAVTQDGAHAFAAGDMHEGETPKIVAGAYTNSHAGTKATALYNVDGTIGALVRQDPPNDGALKAVGKLGTELADTVGFDILSDGKGGNEAWLMTGGSLYAVDLETGAASAVGTVTGVDAPVRDMAILPAA